MTPLSRRVARSIESFGDVFEPEEAAEPILSKGVRGSLLDWITEIFAEAELEAIGLKARRRAMFSGPPGVGKTTLAHHLSARLGLSMLAVRPDRLIDRYLGSTGANIGALFDAAAALDEPIVLFFDEFDALAITRRAAKQSADEERNGFVNTLLQRVEQHDGFLIAATNHADAIDPAIWRRFDMHVALDLPGQFERERILARYLAPFGLPVPALSALAESFATASPALMRQFCEALKRQTVLGPKLGWDMRRESVVERILASVHPHPEAGKPRLWSLGTGDAGARALVWPLPKADEIAAGPFTPKPAEAGEGVVSFPGRRREGRG